MKPNLEDALLFAAQKHRGQTDKSGQPYIFHPIRVMENLGTGASDEERMAALLHDVVEDCGVSLDDLRRAGFPAPVVEAVDFLTKTPEGERDYQFAIERAAQNPIARRVKLADLKDNSCRERLGEAVTREGEERLAKYHRARVFLETL